MVGWQLYFLDHISEGRLICFLFNLESVTLPGRLKPIKLDNADADADAASNVCLSKEPWAWNHLLASLVDSHRDNESGSCLFRQLDPN